MNTPKKALISKSSPRFINLILEQNESISPSIWVCEKEHKQTIAELFPNTIISDHYSANRGILSAELESFISTADFQSLNRSEIEAIPPNILQLLSRFEAFFEFPIIEKTTFLYEVYIKWRKIIELADIQLFVAPILPHDIYDCIIHIIANNQNIPTLFFEKRNFPCTSYNSFSTLLPIVNDSRKSPLPASPKKESIDIAHKIKNAYSAPQERSNGAQIMWEKEQKKSKPSFLPIIKFSKLSQTLIKILTPVPQQTHISSPFQGYGTPPTQRWLKVEYILKRLQTTRLRRHYQKRAKNKLPSQDFVLFALHYQPELTTNPEGGVFCNQYLAIHALRAAIPSSVSIIVKEHPRQLSARARNNTYRSKSFYYSIEKLQNVYLFDERKPSQDLYTQESCKAVATITGSIGWQALIAGKPVIAFGSTWYSDFDRCHIFSNTHDLYNFYKINVSTPNNSPSQVKNDLVNFIDCCCVYTPLSEFVETGANNTFADLSEDDFEGLKTFFQKSLELAISIPKRSASCSTQKSS